MSEFNSKKEWEAAADKLFADGVSPQEINSIVGEYNGPEGTFTVQQAKKSKRGWTPVDKNKRGVRNAKRVKMERDQSMGIGDTVEPRGTTSTSLRSELGAGKGDEIHHRVSLIQNTPFFDGLSEAESREFVSWVNDQGWDIGNQPGNPDIVIPKKEHTGIHAWMRNNGIEGARGPQKRLTERFKGMNLEQRKNAFRDYMYYVQEGVDTHMLDTLGDVSVSTKHNNAQKRNGEIVQAKYNQAATGRNLGDIPSGPRAGQRMPVNRVTLGNAIIDDIVNTGGSVKFKAARALPVIGAAAGLWVAGEQALAGDYQAAAGTVVDEVVSEAFIDSQPTASGTLTDAQVNNERIQQRMNNPTVADKVIQDPINEIEYLGKQMLGGLKQFGGKILFGF